MCIVSFVVTGYYIWYVVNELHVSMLTCKATGSNWFVMVLTCTKYSVSNLCLLKWIHVYTLAIQRTEQYTCEG